MVTTVDPLVVLNCSMLFPSTELSSALGGCRPFSDAGLELEMLPDTEGSPNVFIGMLLGIVDCETFGRGLEPPLAPRTRDACVRLLYVFRMMSRIARMMMMPMTMTAIIAPELWISICSLDFVTVVVFDGRVVLVTGEEVEACIFSNKLWRSTIQPKRSPEGSLSAAPRDPSLRGARGA